MFSCASKMLLTATCLQRARYDDPMDGGKDTAQRDDTPEEGEI